jgi:hypothetical protein
MKELEAKAREAKKVIKDEERKREVRMACGLLLKLQLNSNLPSLLSLSLSLFVCLFLFLLSVLRTLSPAHSLSPVLPTTSLPPFPSLSLLPSLPPSPSHTSVFSPRPSVPLPPAQTLVLVAEGIRRSQEMSEMSHTDADSDAGLPDDSDDLEDDMEVCMTESTPLRKFHFVTL